MFTCVCYTTGIEVGFEVFVHAVFYIGKGRRSRPYEHFKEAVTYFRQTVKCKVCVKFFFMLCPLQFLTLSQGLLINGIKYVSLVFKYKWPYSGCVMCNFVCVIMVALCNRADRYIFILFLSFFLLSFFFFFLA